MINSCHKCHWKVARNFADSFVTFFYHRLRKCDKKVTTYIVMTVFNVNILSHFRSVLMAYAFGGNFLFHSLVVSVLNLDLLLQDVAQSKEKIQWNFLRWNSFSSHWAELSMLIVLQCIKTLWLHVLQLWFSFIINEQHHAIIYWV